jgi:hypothetical protein
MKRTAFLLTVGAGLLALGLCGTWAANGQEPADALRLLQAENTLLKATMVQRDKEIESLKKEIESSKALTAVLMEKLRAKSGVATTPPVAGPTTPGSVTQPRSEPAVPNSYMYKNKVRDDKWFDQMWKTFSDKIACVGGKYLDIGFARLRSYPEEVQAEPPKPGTELRRSRDDSTIFQVLGKEEVLVRTALYDVLFYVKGLDTSQLVNGASFPQVDLVYMGPYTYHASNRATNTIQSFIVYKPLTRDQFAEVLSSDFVLVKYKLGSRVSEATWMATPWQRGLVYRDDPTPGYNKVVSEPVP